MVRRRLIALFTMFSALHLTTAASARACPEHDVAAAEMSGDAHQHGTTATDHSAPDSTVPCDEALSTECCPSAANCSSVAVLVSTTLSQRPNYLAPPVATGLAHAMTTSPTGPEPPPPKIQVLTS